MDPDSQLRQPYGYRQGADENAGSVPLLQGMLGITPGPCA